MKMKLFVPALCTGLIALTTLAHAETYAVIVGISDYPEPVDATGKRLVDEKGLPISDDLPGALNDALTYKDVFVNKYGVKPENIKMLTDKQADEKGFVEAFTWIAKTVKPGDQFIFTYSGHGAQIENKKEADGLDEVIVLADEHLISDDLFGDIAQMFSKAGVNSTFIFDSCFSGGMARGVASFKGQDAISRNRVLDAKRLKKATYVPEAKLATFKTSKKAANAPGSYAFVFASQEDQTSTDLDFKDPKMKDHGLFTLVLTAFIEDYSSKPVGDVMELTKNLIKEKGFEQIPKIEYSDPERARKPLILKS
jgi:hypothetical protein